MASFKQIWVKILGDNSGLKKSVNESQSDLQKFQKTVVKVGAAIGVAFGAQQLVKFGAETVKLAASAEGIRRAFDRIAYGGLLEELQKATAGTVSELKLMQKAVQASNFKLPLETLASLFEFAAKRAQDTGESVDYMVDSLVTGIGRKSVLVLDNLGISAVELREKLGGVGTEMASVGDFAAAVGKIAQEEMAKAGGVVDDVNTKLQQMRAEWELTKEKVGKGLISAFAYLKQGYTDLRDFITFYTEEGVTSIQQLFGKTKEEILAAKPFMKDHGDDWKSIWEEIQEAEKRAESYFKLTDVKFQGKAPKASLLSMGLLTQEIGTVKTIASLEQQITALREKARGATEGEVGAINRKIKALEAEKDRISETITYEAVSNDIKEEATKIKDRLNAAEQSTAEIADRRIEQQDALIEGMLAEEESIGKVTRAMTQADIAAENLIEDFGRLGITVAYSLGSAFGDAASGVKTLAQSLSEISTMIVESLGEILIMAGIRSGIATPQGLGLILAGIGLKGYGTFAANKSNMAYSTGYTGQSANMGTTEFLIRGENLVSAYDNNKRINQRLY